MIHPKQSMVFAHRGANREAAENTRSAFDRALAYPIDGIETDIQLSRDEVAVLWHDRFLGKLGMPFKRIGDFDYAELRAMDFAAHFSPKVAPQGIMSLQEFLDAYRGRCRLLLEIKNRAWEPSSRHEIKVRQTLEAVGAAQGDAVMVSSFNLASLIYAHRCAPQFPLVLNLEPEHGADYARSVLADQPFLHGLCVHIDTLDEAMTAVLRECGKSIAVYTCNSDEEINRALALGVDILISDVPQKALQVRQALPCGCAK
ncbi:MAG: glycerophosphodiester phosphodiesterase [Gallionellales bacterium RIFCSPLOWO2_12_FULL_59_22]|nr:MAG: glycerophosphodiester phosphodiesterase [Gallionellales bacterium RIFCSPLOWO2_02_FULL_59_110]OGT02984.1 MAG: glycerophosphodiester phosphodiesterase [Gallionellales bacterium RIFCSPLOWO2_02_58_13]OGT11661.1 MAG: glycerophosphodiester phosphodiesterase [Gallionellales bacterium RIFCSPLOWO2_12_FULL_59_22]